MSHCTRCEKDVHPVQELQPSGRLVDICPTCSGPVAAIAQVIVADKPRDKPVKPVLVAPQRQTNGGDIVAMAKARLDLLETQIASVREMEREAALLRAMIAAAEQITESKDNHNGHAESMRVLSLPLHS